MVHQSVINGWRSFSTTSIITDKSWDRISHIQGILISGGNGRVTDSVAVVRSESSYWPDCLGDYAEILHQYKFIICKYLFVNALFLQQAPACQSFFQFRFITNGFTNSRWYSRKPIRCGSADISCSNLISARSYKPPNTQKEKICKRVVPRPELTPSKWM